MAIIDFLINHIKLKSRIYAGYIIAGVIAMLMAIIAYTSTISLSSDIDSITRFNSYAAANMSFVSKVTEMQRQALIYIHGGHDWAGERVDTIHKEAIRQIESSQDLAFGEAITITARAKEHLNRYLNTFKKVREQRNIREQLVREDLRIYASQAQQIIEERLEDSYEHNKKETLKYSRTLNALLQIEKNAYRYFDSLDGAFSKAALENIHKTRSLYNTILKSSNRDLQRLGEVSDVLDKYESAFIKAVQRTRGFIFLVNVVMAAEAYETIYQSKRLSELIKADSESLEKKIIAEVISTQDAVLLSVTLLLIFIVIFSYIISKSITLPLDRLTIAFKDLVSGSLNAKIPKYQLQDEFGNLSRAADSFKDKNAELQISKIELERSNDELEQFVHTVSHDLKSPIVTSMGFIGIVQRLVKQGKYKQGFEKLDKVIKSNERMSQLINDLLELSRVGRTDKDKTSIDMNVLLGTFARSHSEHLERRGFKLEIVPNLPVIYANESRTLQIFENFLSNALKYVHNKSGPNLRIGSKEDEENFLIFFEDNGPGIPEAYHDKIFGLFNRLDTTMDGTGIGLAVVKRIMKFHNGDAWVESTQGKGATFWIKFPKKQMRVKNV